MSTLHELKTWPQYFQAVWDGRKKFEIRKNDRNFEVGDRVRLSEWDPATDKYTGRHFVKFITYITAFAQPGDQIVFSISDDPPAAQAVTTREEK